MRKCFFGILIVLVLVSFIPSCSKKYEVQNNTETLKYYLEDLPIEECAWYHEERKDRYSGIGPSTLIFYGMAELDEDYCDEIYDSYEWESVSDNYYVIEKVSNLGIDGLSLDPDNYYFSESYTNDRNSNIALDICLDAKNNIILFYREFQDF